jgi:hypothetical protein
MEDEYTFKATYLGCGFQLFRNGVLVIEYDSANIPSCKFYNKPDVNIRGQLPQHDDMKPFRKKIAYMKNARHPQYDYENDDNNTSLFSLFEDENGEPRESTIIDPNEMTQQDWRDFMVVFESNFIPLNEEQIVALTQQLWDEHIARQESYRTNDNTRDHSVR